MSNTMSEGAVEALSGDSITRGMIERVHNAKVRSIDSLLKERARRIDSQPQPTYQGETPLDTYRREFNATQAETRQFAPQGNVISMEDRRNQQMGSMVHQAQMGDAAREVVQLQDQAPTVIPFRASETPVPTATEAQVADVMARIDQLRNQQAA